MLQADLAFSGSILKFLFFLFTHSLINPRGANEGVLILFLFVTK